MARNQAIHRFHSPRSIGAECGVSAIVQQDYIPTTNFPCDSFFDVVSRRSIPVVPSHVPHDGFKSKLPDDLKCPRPPPSPRGAEKVRVFADRARDRLTASQDFLVDTRARLKNKQRMGEGVIADHVTLPGDRLRDIWTLLDVASNQKESGLDAVLRQHIQ